MVKDINHNFILTSAHCSTHQDNGKVENMEQIRVNLPHIETYEEFPNMSRFKKKDRRFYKFFLEPEHICVYPDYLFDTSPNSGNDIAILKIPI